MTRLVKLWTLGSFTHALLTFTLFPLVLALPDGTAAELASGALSVLLQPFMGPHRLLAADGLLVVAQGLPAMALTSALWGLLVTGIVAAVHHSRRPAYRVGTGM